MKDYDRFIPIATREAGKSSVSSQHHGSVAIYTKGSNAGSVFGRSCNKRSKRIPGTDGGCHTVHSEMYLLHKIPKHLRHTVVIIVVRVNRGGNLVDSRPCVFCSEMARQRNISIIYS